MGDALKKVRTGEPLRIPAPAYNAFIDTALAQRRRQHTTESDPRRLFRQSGLVLMRNDSGADRNRFDVLGISGPLFDPGVSSSAVDPFKNQVALVGVTPARPDHLGRFGVLLEPVASGKLGLACVSGVCVARLSVQQACHRFADIQDGAADSLQSTMTGSTAILWKMTGGDWAIVHLGVQGTEAFPVRVTNDGGVPGDLWTDCTLTYSAKDLCGQDLGAGLTPDQARVPGTEYRVAGGDSPGLGYYDENGDFKLYSVAQEVPVTDIVDLPEDVQVSGTSVQFLIRKVRVLEKDSATNWVTWDTGTNC